MWGITANSYLSIYPSLIHIVESVWMELQVLIKQKRIFSGWQWKHDWDPSFHPLPTRWNPVCLFISLMRHCPPRCSYPEYIWPTVPCSQGPQGVTNAGIRSSLWGHRGVFWSFLVICKINLIKRVKSDKCSPVLLLNIPTYLHLCLYIL